MTEKPVLVDLVIAIHDASRPLARALASLEQQGLERGTELRVTVVCHNISIAEIKATLPSRLVEGVRFIELKDGIRSPAGPFNRGLEEASGTYFSIMGSDDSLEPGALAAWVAIAEGNDAAVVMAPMRLATGQLVRTPVHRPGRARSLNAVRDRLSYRSAPLGLVRRDTIEQLGLSFAVGLPTGEDQLFCLRLWYSGLVVSYARNAPKYVVGVDAVGRVSGAARPLAEEFAAIEGVIDSPWFASLSATERASVVTKIIRVHVFSAASVAVSRAWAEADRAYFTGLLARLVNAGPGALRPLSIADRRLVDAIINASETVETIEGLAAARRKFGRPATIITRDIRGQFAAEGPIRFMAASALV